ncbi:adenylate kinase [Candidatus Micrarchaeota archaeon]|nr:adenylate kinase [Candidatus Micrarchaeota archaeon]MBD3418292.1 adenylate kinase [Candidatus Micrarchaeota archaeon]
MIIVMGLPGAGKSTVMKGVSADVKMLNYGTLMFEIAKEKFGISNRDKIRKLPVGQQKEVQAAVAEKLSSESGKVVLDTHCSIKTSKGYFPGLPFELLSKLDVEALVLITAKPEEVFARRQNDPTRDRKDDVKLEDVQEHDDMNRALLAAYAAHRGCPAKIIYNAQGKMEEASAQLQAILE